MLCWCGDVTEVDRNRSFTRHETIYLGLLTSSFMDFDFTYQTFMTGSRCLGKLSTAVGRIDRSRELINKGNSSEVHTESNGRPPRGFGFIVFV